MKIMFRNKTIDKILFFFRVGYIFPYCSVSDFNICYFIDDYNGGLII